MLATLTVYTYRDIWQLATYDQKPLDAAEGWFVWAEIGLVAFIAVLLPLFTPRQYVPIDPTVRIRLSFNLCTYQLIDEM